MLLVNIDVADLAAATSFYTRVFGLTIGRRFGTDAVELLGATAPIYLLVKKPGSPAFRGGTAPRSYERHWTPLHLDFVVADIRAAIGRAIDCGAHLESDVSEHPWGRIAVLADPFGHGFCFMEMKGRGYDEIASPAPATRDDARPIIDALGLERHPEGGWFRETFRAPASTAIYYLLPAGEVSRFHRVRSDEVWHFHGGDPLELHTIDDAGRHTLTLLGGNVVAGERPQAVVPANVLQAAAPRGRYTLCGCTVAPAFRFEDFEMPAREDLLRRFPQHAALIARF
jgi:predicted cupin superfamily sugar epimerase/predicted enzyme related to lactoylglutathione lyase